MREYIGRERRGLQVLRTLGRGIYQGLQATPYGAAARAVATGVRAVVDPSQARRIAVRASDPRYRGRRIGPALATAMRVAAPALTDAQRAMLARRVLSAPGLSDFARVRFLRSVVFV